MFIGRPTQIGEAGVHLAAHGAALRPGLDSWGRSRDPGSISARYSAMASVSQIDTVWSGTGTRNDGDSRSSSARAEGSSTEAILLEVEPRQLAQEPAPQRPRGIVLAAYG